MIELIMNSPSSVGFTLNEQTDFMGFETWILEVKYKETDFISRMVLDPDNDMSLNKERYNEFLIIEGYDLNLEPGQWDYIVYESGLTAGNADVLNPDTFGDIVEIGRLRVYDEN